MYSKNMGLHELFIQNLKDKLPDHISLIEKTYINSKTPALFHDAVHGDFWARPDKIITGRKQHPNRKQKRGPSPKRSSEAEFRAKLPPHLEVDFSTFKGLKASCTFFDKDYNNAKFEAIPRSVFRNMDTHHPDYPVVSKRALTVEEIKNRLPAHVTIDESTYRTASEKATFIDSEFGPWEALVDNVINGKSSHSERTKLKRAVHHKIRKEKSLLTENIENKRVKRRKWEKDYNQIPEVKLKRRKIFEAYYDKNGDELREKAREYSKNNREKIALYENERYHSDLNFKLRKVLRNRLWSALQNNQKVGSAVRDLGCSIEFLRQYLEDRFEPGMSWDNYGFGQEKWNIDHIVPLSAFNLSNREQFLTACHYTNLQPLWHSLNGIKSDSMPWE